MTKRAFPPIHPGEILLEDFLKPIQVSQYHLAQAIGVPPRRINEIVHGKRGITADTALRLGMFVAQIVGKSMEPTIPDGSYCLFMAPVIGTRQGQIVLVQLRDTTDPDNGERYTVKRYQSEKVTDGDSWRHARITLKPLNPDFQSIEAHGCGGGRVAGRGQTHRGARGCVMTALACMLHRCRLRPFTLACRAAAAGRLADHS